MPEDGRPTSQSSRKNTGKHTCTHRSRYVSAGQKYKVGQDIGQTGNMIGVSMALLYKKKYLYGIFLARATLPYK